MNFFQQMSDPCTSVAKKTVVTVVYSFSGVPRGCIFSKCRGDPLWSPCWAGTRHCPYPELLRRYPRFLPLVKRNAAKPQASEIVDSRTEENTDKIN